MTETALTVDEKKTIPYVQRKLQVHGCTSTSLAKAAPPPPASFPVLHLARAGPRALPQAPWAQSNAHRKGRDLLLC